MLTTGMCGKKEILVDETVTAKAIASGLLDVYATPCMISLIEETAWKSIQAELEDGQGTVGTLLNIRHLSATPVGMHVRCETELIEIDRRRLVFAVNVFDDCGKVGEGTHERFIIDNDRFLKKAYEKRQQG